MRPVDQPEQLRSSSTSTESLIVDRAIQANLVSSKIVVPFRCKDAMVKAHKDPKRCYTRVAANLPPPEYRHNYTDSGSTIKTLTRTKIEATEISSSLVTKRLIFRSCAHMELLPFQSTNSTFYMDKSLSIPLGSAREDKQGLHRSTLSLYLRGGPFSSNSENSQEVRVPFRSSTDWNMANASGNGTGGQSCHLGDMATVNFRLTSPNSAIVRANLTPLPFRARCHSSSAAVRLIGKANDVSGPLQSNREGGTENPENSGRNVRGSCDGRMPCTEAETVTKVQECLVSPHILNCTCGSASRNQPSFMSLKEALELFRPDFISRSQRRVHQLEQRARERRSLQAADLTLLTEATNRRQNCTKPLPLSDNLFKPKDRAISGKEMQLRSRRIYNKLPEVTKKKEEEKRRLLLQTNRLRAEVFKKKLLDQILQRNSD